MSKMSSSIQIFQIIIRMLSTFQNNSTTAIGHRSVGDAVRQWHIVAQKRE